MGYNKGYVCRDKMREGPVLHFHEDMGEREHLFAAYLLARRLYRGMIIGYTDAAFVRYDSDKDRINVDALHGPGVYMQVFMNAEECRKKLKELGLEYIPIKEG